MKQELNDFPSELSQTKEIDDRYLREMCNTPKGPYLRPFFPNPKWYEARIFIVGTNPATPLRNEFESFDEYWRSLTQAPEEFERKYSQKHGSGQSKSTARAQRFQNRMHPINVLATNSIIYPGKYKGIPNKANQRKIGTSCFQYLLGVCKPSSVLFHGSKAVKLAADSLGVNLDRYQPIDCQDTVIHNPIYCHLFAFPHFSGQGARGGYKVREMDAQLARLAVRLKELENQLIQGGPQ